MHDHRSPHPRDEHLKRCPERRCAKARRCLVLAMGGECIRTHLRDDEEFAGYMLDKINAFNDQGLIDDPDGECLEGEAAKAAWYKIFREVQAEREARGELPDYGRILSKHKPGEVGYIAPRSSARHPR
jgi:hypothetical protein